MSEQTLVVRMTETQMKALEQFISRVNLNAKEVGVFKFYDIFCISTVNKLLTFKTNYSYVAMYGDT